MACKALPDDELAVVLKLVIDVHPAADAAYVSMAGILPKTYVIIIITGFAILSHPFIPAYDAELTGKHIFVGVNHRIISRPVNGKAEGIHNINHLLVGKSLMAAILNIKHDGIVDRIRRNPFQYHPGFLCGLLRRGCIGVKIHASAQTGCLSPCNIGGKLGIYPAFTASCLDKGKIDTGGRHLAPVYGAVMLGDVDPPGNRAARRYCQSLSCGHHSKYRHGHKKCKKFSHHLLLSSLFLSISMFACALKAFVRGTGFFQILLKGSL